MISDTVNYDVIKRYPKKSIMMKVTSNGQTFTLKNEIHCRKLWVRKLMMKNVYTTYEFLKIQMDISSLNQVNDANTGKDFYFTLPVAPSAVLAYTKDYENVKDYSDAETISIKNMAMHVYIGETYLADGILADNPLLIELSWI